MFCGVYKPLNTPFVAPKKRQSSLPPLRGAHLQRNVGCSFLNLAAASSVNHKAGARICPTPGRGGNDVKPVASAKSATKPNVEATEPCGSASGPPSLVARKSASALFTATPHETAWRRDARAVEQEGYESGSYFLWISFLEGVRSFRRAARTWVGLSGAMMRSM